jgi:hypothetical protein
MDDGMIFETNPMDAIIHGAFGYGSPAFAFGDVVPPPAQGGVATFREAYLFTPGAMNWAYIPGMELPAESMRGVPIAANLFSPVASQVYVYHSVVDNGLGGLQHGVLELTPLSELTGEG